VLRSAGRWSDVFRLIPPAQAVIGRASSNQIVIRNHQASRHHARVEWQGGVWTIIDQGSRNGTIVNGQKIGDQPHPLSHGDVIEIAGFAITFMRRIEGGVGDAASPKFASSQATDEQLTREIDPGAITDRRRFSSYLHGSTRHGADRASDGGARDSRIAASHRLLQLAFTLARGDEASQSIESVLEELSQNVSFETAGMYLCATGKTTFAPADLMLAGARQSGARSYRRPPDSLIELVIQPDGQAILVRNVVGDESVATENSRGELDVDSLILAPVRDHESRLWGLIHLTTREGATPLGADDLEFVVACSEILAASLVRLAERRHLSRSLRQTRQQLKELQQRLGDKVQIIGHSEAIQQVVSQISLAAPTNATVLILGESGVGKELVAAALHHASKRSEGPFVCMNCAALSPNLLESELFGHEKGSFTGATERKRGKFEVADGGTLMLDEIGEMDAEIQAKFLRVLEGHSFERVGGHDSVHVDVRVVAATNRDLQQMVRDGKFRQDLYYRLHVIEIAVPPLRQRGNDCLLLAEYFLDRFNREMGRKIEGFTDAAKKRLLSYSWPGNIRELKNVVERAVVLNTRNRIEDSDLSLSPAVEQHQAKVLPDGPVEMSLADLEQLHIERVLRYTEGNKSRAAAILGIERSTLDRKLKRFQEDES
jgi:Nif-specific regulatory protein